MEGRARRKEFQLGLEIATADTVVDVGCGAGDACVFAGALGAEVIATDCDPIALARVAERMRGVPARGFRALLSDSDPLPLPDGTASVVICTEVLEHVDDPVRILAELARIGRPGARYLLSVPDPASEELMRVVAPAWYFEKPIHQHVYQRHEFAGLVAAAGLEVEHRALDGFYWAIWWAFRMAVGAEPGAPTPAAPLLAHWENTWDALLATPRGPALAEALGRLIPKSQVVLARKPGGLSPSSFGGPVWRRSRWKRLVRDGAIRLGGFDLRWQVRRAGRVQDEPGRR